MQCSLKVINDALPQLNTHVNNLVPLKCLNIIILDYTPHI